MKLPSRNTVLATFTIFCFVSMGVTWAANGRFFETPKTVVPQLTSSPVSDQQLLALAGPDRNPREIRRAPAAVERPELRRKPRVIKVSNDVLHSLDMHEETVEAAAVDSTKPPTETAKTPTESIKSPGQGSKPLTGPDGRVVLGVGAAAAVAAILLNNSDDPQLEPPLSP